MNSAQEPLSRAKISTFLGLLAVIIGFITSVLFSIVPSFEFVIASQLGAPMATALLHSSLDGVSAIISPTVGLGGTTMLTATDFVMVEGRLGAQFVGAGKVVSFPAAVGSVQNIELDRGQVEFWYRPNYDAGSDDDTGHALIVVGDMYDVPRLELQESDRLSLVLMEADWTDHTVSAGYHAPLWTAGQWVHIRATWDTALTTDALKLYVNDTRVDSGGAAGGWNLSETTIGNIFVGSADASGNFVADGIIDELVIRDEPQTPATPTPTPTGTPLTPTPTATGTPTLMPGCIDRTNPALVVTPAAQSLQLVGTPFTAPDFCTTLRRVSNTSDSGGFETQIYNQLQAFSSDNVYLLLDGSDGFVVRRVSDLSLVTGLDTSGWNDPRWHPVQPHVMIHVDSNDDTTLRAQYTNIDTLQTTTIFTFPAQYERIRVPQSFDEISAMNDRSDRVMSGRFQWDTNVLSADCICQINSIGSGHKVASAAVCWYNSIEGSLLLCWGLDTPIIHEVRLPLPTRIVKVHLAHS